jgi:Flp pilus assembly protein TadG
MMRIKEKLYEQSGGAAAEFAILLIFLVMLLFGIIEFSLILYNQAVITNASREGARAGIVFTNGPRVTATDIEAVVNAYCAQYLITAPPMGTPNITVTPGTDPGDPLTVRVQYHYDFFVLPRLPIPYGMTGWQPGIDLSARTIMRLE